MPPRKNKKEVTKTENPTKVWNIEDPINLNSWKCVVTMGIEKSIYDNFVLKIFNEECSKGCRQAVSIIDHDTVIMKILNDFAKGELPYKYAFLLNFSSVFKEAVDYINKKITIPVLVLVKVVKALLFYLREESLTKIEKLEAGTPDPIEAMMARPTTFGNIDVKKKEAAKKGDNGFTVRPPSVTKEDTELLKRGEKAKDDQRIDDAPLNSYFQLYVLLTGFYDPNFPLELIKAGIPLHAIICIDTSFSGVSHPPSERRKTVFSKNLESKAFQIETFWKAFLKMVWSPEFSYYFKDTILQMYVPQSLLCEKNALRDFIYREISYLMYDMSDLRRQLKNYLDHMQLWNVSGPKLHSSRFSPESKHLPNECVSVPLVLQYIIDEVCKNVVESESSSGSLISLSPELEHFAKVSSPSVKNTHGSCEVEQKVSQELRDKGNFNLLSIYYKIVELDEKYELDNKSVSSIDSEKDSIDADSTQEISTSLVLECGENMEEALAADGTFRSYWKKYQDPSKLNVKIDHCLYPLFMTKISCPFQTNLEGSPSRSYQSVKKNSYFKIIKNLSDEMRKPHFTVTEGSRSILKCLPYNVKNSSRDFFFPEQLKIVSPEKLKASSAPEFRVTSRIKVQQTFVSEMFPKEVLGNPFECLRGFVNDCVFSNASGFDFLEFLNKSKLSERQHHYWDEFNCIDHFYSHLTDSIFFMLHNRKDSDNIQHETFNEMLRTEVGLRDFYDYIMEDEAEWISRQEEYYQAAAMLANKMLERDSFRHFSEMDFWLTNSIKFNTVDKNSKEGLMDDIRTEYSSMENLSKRKMKSFKNLPLNSQTFEGYDVSEMSVQYSGLKSVYYSKDCNVTVQLIERLYGSQDLGVHLSAGYHTLHLYSYVCPEPHTLDPFMFHVTYKNGIIVVFSRRTIETSEEVEEMIQSQTQIKRKKNSSELSMKVVKKQIFKKAKDEEFFYDAAASLPNGLSIRVVRSIVKPCYIKQFFLAKAEEIERTEAHRENSRLFLPNGNVVKIMNDGTVQILKIDSSIITANLYHLTDDYENGRLDFKKYEVVFGDGYTTEYLRGEVISSKRFQIFQNTEAGTGRIYFRRRDGTNYLLETDGTLTIQFKDGTRMSTMVTMEEPETLQNDVNQPSDSDFETDAVLIHMMITFEHPDYVTVVYDSQKQVWKLILPNDSTIIVHADGHYSVDIDKQTELTVQKDIITVNRFSEEKILESTFRADLTVFEAPETCNYCQFQEATGKTFVVEANSNCYLLHGEIYSENFPVEIEPRESDISEFVASADLQTCPCFQTDKGSSLSLENKYFMVRRDMTGVEVLHVENMMKILAKAPKGALVFTQNIPGTQLRYFVLISPKLKRKIKQWEVETILPNPKYEPNSNKRTISSTYGIPPSWTHPFPKQKFSFVIPESLTGRLFVETKKTNFTPEIGVIDYYNCKMEEEIEKKHTVISPEEVEEYFRRLSNDNQNILREMYALAVSSIINQNKKLKPINTEKLKQYQKLSKYIVEKREYHKACLRYHIVPNYFCHPNGMSWLILSDLLGSNFLLEKPKSEVHSKKDHSDKAQAPSRRSSEFSNEEIEYDLSISGEQSFSELSWRSSLSAQTAPAILNKRGVCRCKVNPVRLVASCAAVKFHCNEQEQPTKESSRESVTRLCHFETSEIDMNEKKEHEKKKQTALSWEDLLYLGLV